MLLLRRGRAKAESGLSRTPTTLREAAPETHARPHRGTGLVAPAEPTALREPRHAYADRAAAGKPHALRWPRAGGSGGGWAAMPCRGRGRRRDQGRAGPEGRGVRLTARHGPPRQRAASRAREQGALGAASRAGWPPRWLAVSLASGRAHAGENALAALQGPRSTACRGHARPRAWGQGRLAGPQRQLPRPGHRPPRAGGWVGRAGLPSRTTDAAPRGEER
jgi:hypothetical protein